MINVSYFNMLFTHKSLKFVLYNTDTIFFKVEQIIKSNKNILYIFGHLLHKLLSRRFPSCRTGTFILKPLFQLD